MSNAWEDDEDAFLYGDEGSEPAAGASMPTASSSSLSHVNGVSHVSAKSIDPSDIAEPDMSPAQADFDMEVQPEIVKEDNLIPQIDVEEVEGEPLGDEINDEGEEEEEESDVEIIMEDVVPARSVDFRNQAGVKPFVPSRVTVPATISPAAPPIERRPVHLTTEYTPVSRPPVGGAIPPPSSIVKPPAKVAQQTPTVEQATALGQIKVAAPVVIVPEPVHPGEDDNADGSAIVSEAAGATKVSDPTLLDLPAARASASAPKIDPTTPGLLPNKTSVFDIEMDNIAEKSWRRPGSDLSDWFNYGFDEISWEAYCVRRRELGEAAAMLKGAVLNLAALPEEHIQHIPPEMRSTLIAQASLMGVGMPQGPGMMGPGGMMGGPQGMMMGHHPGGGGGGGMDHMGMGMGMPDMMAMNEMNGMSGMMGMHPQMNGMNAMNNGGGGGGGGPGMGGPGMGGPGMGGAGMRVSSNMMQQQQPPLSGGMNAVPPGAGQLLQEAPMNGNIGLLGMGAGGGAAAPKAESPEVSGGSAFGGGPGEGGTGGDGASEQGMPGSLTGVGSEYGQQDPSQGMLIQQQGAYGAGMDHTMRGGLRGGVRGGRGFAAGARGGIMYAGRGRGGAVAGVPRPVSPLPSNVPTGPRNQRSYKDKDREASDSKAVEIDYGGSVSGRGSAEREREKDRDRGDRDRDRDSHRDRKDKDKERDRDHHRSSRRDRDKDKDRDREKDDDSHRDKESRRDSGSSRKDKDEKSSSSRKRRNSTSEDGKEKEGRSSKRR
ncbi:cleavage polyadenylation factor subunit fip1 [Tulasnella sp. JGI-2019a]|nr:cleavage polyadenylation factor subunit fip1 [Tulasnella sp. JGI-2019a]